MMHDQIDDQQRRAIAYLVNQIRPGWHTNGIMAALRNTDAPLADTALAALWAAKTRTDQHTPAVIALEGDHWHLGTQPTQTAAPGSKDTPQGPTCYNCGKPRHIHDAINAKNPGWCPEYLTTDQHHRRWRQDRQEPR